MRHILVHAYYSIDLDAVWRVIEQHLPSLVQQLEIALRDFDQAGSGESDPSSSQ